MFNAIFVDFCTNVITIKILEYDDVNDNHNQRMTVFEKNLFANKSSLFIRNQLSSSLQGTEVNYMRLALTFVTVFLTIYRSHSRSLSLM